MRKLLFLYETCAVWRQHLKINVWKYFHHSRYDFFFFKNELSVRIVVPFRSAFIKVASIVFDSFKNLLSKKFQWDMNTFDYTYIVIDKNMTHSY